MRIFNALSALLLVFAAAPSFAYENSVMEITGLASTQSTLDFGTVQVLETRYRDLKITNKSSAPITGLHFAVTGRDYSARENCPDTLAPQAKCWVRVKFRPTLVGGAYGKLQILSNEESQTISLYGWGEERSHR